MWRGSDASPLSLLSRQWLPKPWINITEINSLVTSYLKYSEFEELLTIYNTKSPQCAWDSLRQFWGHMILNTVIKHPWLFKQVCWERMHPSLPYRVSSQGQMATLLHLQLFTLAITPQQERYRPHKHYFLQVSQRWVLPELIVKFGICLTMLTYIYIFLHIIWITTTGALYQLLCCLRQAKPFFYALINFDVLGYLAFHNMLFLVELVEENIPNAFYFNVYCIALYLFLSVHFKTYTYMYHWRPFPKNEF